MKIEHIAIWVNDLEKMKQFYQNYFDGKPNSRYHNPIKNFTSYFLEFESGCRLELMHKTEISENVNNYDNQKIGITHLAFSTGSKENVDSLTERLRNDDYKIVGEPRTTGDGYYESVVLDPENNIVEITE
ncbi:MAG TPA: VOC family protein [Sphingobacterium sp.]|jgi:lactoylglutathione lyase|nr:VOC family protein [Sphingobacterium sp.]